MCITSMSSGVIMIKGSIKWPGWTLHVNKWVNYQPDQFLYVFYDAYIIMCNTHCVYNIQANLLGYMITIFNGPAGHCVCKVG